MEFYNFPKSESNYNVIINEEEEIYLKEFGSGEIISLTKEKIGSVKEAKERFGSVPVLKEKGAYFVLNKKIKNMELVVDCSVKSLKEINEIKNTEKKYLLLDKIAELKSVDITNSNLSPDTKFILMIIWHRNLLSPVVVKVKEYKNPKDLIKCMDALREVRNELGELRVTRYISNTDSNQFDKPKIKNVGRGRASKQWAK